MSHTYIPPPMVQGPSRRICPNEALTHIQTYLEDAKTNAHLHPDAILTEAGAKLKGTSGEVGIVLHNLKRVEAGLRGEVLAVEDLPQEDTGEDLENGFAGKKYSRGFVGRAPWRQNKTDGSKSKDWQNLDEYQLQQEEVVENNEEPTAIAITNGHIPDITPDQNPDDPTKLAGTAAVADASAKKMKKSSKRKAQADDPASPEVSKKKMRAEEARQSQTNEEVVEGTDLPPTASKADKAARKEAKKARQKAEKRVKEEKKSKKAAAEVS